MQVILLERVEKLGQMGQVVNVKPGYARNCLLPKKKALRATKQNLSFFETKRVELEASNLTLKSEAQKVAEKMEGVMISLIRQASEMGHLYGSVRSADIAQSLEAAGYKISRTQVLIDNPIKYLGMHQVRVLLHPEVFILVGVNVAQSEEEAAVQAAAQTKIGASVAGTSEGEEPIAPKATAGKKEAAADKKGKAKATKANDTTETPDESSEAE